MSEEDTLFHLTSCCWSWENRYICYKIHIKSFFLLELFKFLKGENCPFKNCTSFGTKVKSVEGYTEPHTLRKPQE